MEAQLIEGKLFKSATRNVRVSKTEARSYYAENPDRFRVGVSRRIAFIAFPTRRQAAAHDPSTWQAASVREDIQLTVVERRRVPKRVWAIIQRLRTSQPGRPVKLGKVWFIIRPLGGVELPHSLTFAEVSESLRVRLMSQKRKRAFATWFARATKRANVRYLDPSLASP